MLNKRYITSKKAEFISQVAFTLFTLNSRIILKAHELHYTSIHSTDKLLEMK